MKIPLIDLSAQHRELRREILAAVQKVMDSNQFILNDRVRELEDQLAGRAGVRYAISVASGSDALYLALLALGIGPGDEVITTPFTFFATAGAISRTGAKPVFADIDLKTYNIDPQRIGERITPRTKAIVPVHLFGLCCDMDPILKIAKKHSLAVVEDAAQSFGAEYRDKPAGSFGDAGCLSFYPTKNFGGVGDGGMVLSSSGQLNDKIRLLRNHGSRHRYYHESVGVNSRFDEIQAAVLLVKLKRVDAWNRHRQKHAADYNQGLKGLPVRTPEVPSPNVHVFHLYSILAEKREALENALAQCGIGSGVYYPTPLHLQPCYSSLGYRRGDYPAAEQAAAQILSLPMYPTLTEPAKRFVISKIKEFYSGQVPRENQRRRPKRAVVATGR